MDTLDDDPMTAAALFEKAAPDLDPPTALGMEPGPPYHIARWAVRTAGGAYRMKVAVEAAARADVLRGARVVRAVGAIGAIGAMGAVGGMGARGLSVPEVHCAYRVLDRVEVTVVVERRLGTSDAFSVWPMLGPVGRSALVEPAAAALRALHAFREGDLDLPIAARVGDDPAKEALGPLLLGPLGLLESAIARERLPDDLRRALHARVETQLEALPTSLDRRLCHGTFGPHAMCLDRRAFVGLRDFEAARWGDPWEDLTCWIAGTTDFGTRGAEAIVATYLAGASPPPRLADRIDLYFGADLIRGLVWAPADAPTQVLDRFLAALDTWGSGKAALTT